MKAINWMRGTLIVMSIYTALIGGLFLFAPQVAEGMFGIELSDPVLTPLYGQVVLSIVVLALLIASDPARYARLVWGLILHEAAHVSILVYTLTSGLQTFQQVGPPLVANSIFLVVLVVFQIRLAGTALSDRSRQPA